MPLGHRIPTHEYAREQRVLERAVKLVGDVNAQPSVTSADVVKLEGDLAALKAQLSEEGQTCLDALTSEPIFHMKEDLALASKVSARR